MKKGVFCGILFFWQGGSSPNMCDNPTSIGSFQIQPFQQVVGFKGYFDKKGINSLGLMIKEEKQNFLQSWRAAGER